jgi:hypothetical protein
MKYKILKKKIIIEACIIAGFVGALGAGAYFIDMFSDEYQNKSATLESEVNAINTQTRALRDKFSAVQREAELYKSIMAKFNDGGLSLTRQALYDKFTKYKMDYHLNDLRLTMGPVAVVAAPDYKRPSVEIVSSDIVMDFTAIADEHVFRMLDTMRRNLPGTVRIVSMELTAVAPLTDDVLHTIGEKGNFSLIKGTVHFTWFGLKTVEASDTNANAAKH